jgi:hypothetical protein
MSRPEFFLAGAVVIWAASVAWAGVYANRVDGELTVNGVALRRGWWVNAPYFGHLERGTLAVDPEGESPLLTFSKEKGAAATWTILINSNKERWTDRSPRNAKDDWQRWESRAESRLRVSEGAFKGWYVGANEKGEFRLTKVPKEAALFVLTSSFDYKSTSK